MKRPVDILRRLVAGAIDWHLYFSDRGRRGGEVGEAYQAMTSPEEREAIKKLRSEDTANDRWPESEYWFDKTEQDAKQRESNYRRDKMIEESKK